MLQWGAVWCGVVQCVAVCCSVLQCVAVCSSVLQCVAVCCSVLQCTRGVGKTSYREHLKINFQEHHRNTFVAADLNPKF